MFRYAYGQEGLSERFIFGKRPDYQVVARIGYDDTTSNENGAFWKADSYAKPSRVHHARARVENKTVR